MNFTGWTHLFYSLPCGKHFVTLPLKGAKKGSCCCCSGCTEMGKKKKTTWHFPPFWFSTSPQSQSVQSFPFLLLWALWRRDQCTMIVHFFFFCSLCNFPSDPFFTETNHCGPPGVQRGALPPFPGGAPWEHHQWCCPHGWLFMHTWWPQGAHCGRMQFCAPGSPGPSVWVYGQCKSLFSFVFLSCYLVPSSLL